MNKYLINHLSQSRFGSIVTLLDYKTQISKCLKSIKIFPNHKEKLLIDTLLCSGMNEYRFIATTLNSDGTIDLDRYEYVSVDEDILKQANEIVKHQPVILENSILPKFQKKAILET